MRRSLTTAVLLALVAGSAAEAAPRAVQAPARAQPSAAVKARQHAMTDFDARMSRLDRLMGVPSTPSLRSRAAEAGR